VIGARRGSPLAVGYGDGEMFSAPTRLRWRVTGRLPIGTAIAHRAASGARSAMLPPAVRGDVRQRFGVPVEGQSPPLHARNSRAAEVVGIPRTLHQLRQGGSNCRPAALHFRASTGFDLGCGTAYYAD